MIFKPHVKMIETTSNGIIRCYFFFAAIVRVNRKPIKTEKQPKCERTENKVKERKMMLRIFFDFGFVFRIGHL